MSACLDRLYLGFSGLLLFAIPKFPDAMMLVFVVFYCLCVIDYWVFFYVIVCLFVCLN